MPSWAAGLFVVPALLIAAACGPAAVPSISPSPIPTPVITPDPHLTEPVTADQIFRALSAAKLGMRANNATLGGGDPAIVKVINADIADWPLRITEFRSSAHLATALEALDWSDGSPPVRNQAPFAVAGLNVLIQYGPIARAAAPKAPDADRQAHAAAIVAALDPLLWPLAQHSVVTLPVRTADPAASPASPAKPSSAPSKAP